MKNSSVSAKPCILHLSDPASVLSGSDLSGPVYWICDRHPSQVLGALLGDPSEFEGAWVENFRILVTVGGRSHIFEVPESAPSSRVDLAGRALRRVLRGESALKIQEALAAVPASYKIH